MLVAVTSALGVGGYWATNRFRRWQEERRNHVSRSDMELRTPISVPPVLVIEGTVDNRKFEIVTRGFTNYFRKETWGAEKGQRSFLGGQKPGGFSVVIRTKNFSGNWQSNWNGRRGGGGGRAVEVYEDDLLPGRFLWSSRGFIGAVGNYEYHNRIYSVPPSTERWEEEYRSCYNRDRFMIPGQILWSHLGYGYLGWYPLEGRVFKVRSFRFQEAPAEDWFEARVKEYFPPHSIFKTTNAEPINGAVPAIAK